MKANELRIGNYINMPSSRYDFDFNGSHVTVVNSRNLGIIESESMTAKGIPITHEWLKVFGFEPAPMSETSLLSWQKEIDDWRYVIEVTSIDKGWYTDGVNYPFIYVHQLQNIFYSKFNLELHVHHN